MNIQLMEMNDSARFTELEHTQWWREASDRIKGGVPPYDRWSTDIRVLLRYCSPGSSIVLLFPNTPTDMRNLVDPRCRIKGKHELRFYSLSQLTAYEMENPSIEMLTSALYAYVNKSSKGWLYVEHAFVTETSLCLVLAYYKRDASACKKVDDIVLDLTRVWSPWLKPNDPKVFKWFSENMTSYLDLYGHQRELEIFDSYRLSDETQDPTTRLFDLSLTHYVKNISLPFSDSHTVFMNLQPCSEIGGHTNIDADFIEGVKKSMYNWKWH